MRILSCLGLSILLCSSVALAQGRPEVHFSERHDVSPNLRDVPQLPPEVGAQRQIPLRMPFPPQAEGPVQHDPALQTALGPLANVTTGLNFLGVGVGLGNFTDCCAPPDTNGAVGATQFVQWVNLSFAVFDKTTGALVMGPVAGNTLWSGFGGACETNNSGDPIAQYDKAANRWVLAQPVFVSPFLYCIAVSTTSDATGTYNRYQFSMPNFPDYPKLGVWPDGYYATFNMFSGNTFLGARACAFDRNAMLAGAAATAVCFQQGSTIASLLPSDLDGSTAPPAGSPNFFLTLGTNALSLFKFHVDFVNTNNSTFTGPTTITVSAFTQACNGGGSCIPQPSTATRLASLGDRLMYRLSYRNFGDHEALAANHSVSTTVTGRRTTGVRWYEVRSPNGTPTVFQQATFAPDTTSRWMGSIATDKAGDLAVGYSVSSSSLFPSIRFTGRVPTDALNTLQAESTLITGAGSQNALLTRWGDYSSISVDPVDNCTFWYTSEYLMNTGSFNWSTRIGSFKFPGCL